MSLSLSPRAFGRGLSLVLMMLCLAAPRCVSANTEMRAAMTEMAAAVKQALDGEQVDALAVQFNGPANFPTSAGPGLTQMLTEELQKKGLTVKARARYGLKGEYRLTEVPSENPDDARLGTKVLAMNIRANIENEFGKSAFDFSFDRKIRGEATVTGLMGAPVSLPPGGTEKERDKELREQIVEPKSAIKGSVVRTKPDSPYAIEVIAGGEPCPAENKDGLAFITLQRDQLYSVKLYNDTDLEAAVQLSIDGLSMFAFSKMKHTTGPKKDQPLYTVVVIPPRKATLIHGWHVDNESSDRFVITEYAKSAAATINHTTNIGTITASFQACWPVGSNPPADEPGKQRGNPGDATGFGPPIDVTYKEVQRTFGVIRDSVSVRYSK